MRVKGTTNSQVQVYVAIWTYMKIHTAKNVQSEICRLYFFAMISLISSAVKGQYPSIRI